MYPSPSIQDVDELRSGLEKPSLVTLHQAKHPEVYDHLQSVCKVMKLVLVHNPRWIVFAYCIVEVVNDDPQFFLL